MQKLCLDYLFQNSLPLFLCWTANGVVVHLCLFSSPSLPLSRVLPTWALECTYLSSVARQRGRKTFFFLLIIQIIQGEEPWAQSAYLKTFQIQFVFALSVFQVWSFPCQGEWNWHKENNECNFFPPVTVRYTAFSSSLCEFI